MKIWRIILVSGLALLIVGCRAKSADSAIGDGPPSTTVGASKPGAQDARPGGGGAGDSGTITPIGSNVGPITPVAGGENLDGGTGGGIAQAAKSKAHDVANQSTNDATSAATGGE